MRSKILSAALLAAVVLSGCSTTTSRKELGALSTVERVDVTRYMGTWYEIANITHSFQKGCYATTATYSKREDGQIDVLNSCRKGAVDGPEKKAKGRAKVADPVTNSKLKVSFFRPFWGDYWIIELDEDYQYAVVGHPSRDYMWILSRTPTMDPVLYSQLVARLEEKGYEIGRFSRTVHPSRAK